MIIVELFVMLGYNISLLLYYKNQMKNNKGDRCFNGP